MQCSVQGLSDYVPASYVMSLLSSIALLRKPVGCQGTKTVLVPFGSIQSLLKGKSTF